MAQEFDPIEEVRKHPGIAAGVVFVLAGIGLATVLLNQRTGPRRYEILRERVDPRGWVDADSLRSRVSDFARGLRDSVSDLGAQASELGGRASERASELGELAQERASRWTDEARQFGHDWQRKGSRERQRQFRDYKKKARRYAEDAGDYARDHAREGGAILAVATIAAVVGAALLEAQKKGDGLRD